MASFTAVGDEIILDVDAKGEQVDVAISGTYAMSIILSREVGSRNSGTWQRMQTWDTANATVAYSFTNDTVEQRYRLHVLVDTSGTATATMAEAGTDVAFEGRAYAGSVKDPKAGDLITFTQAGAVFPGDLTVAGALSVTGPQTGEVIVHATSTLAVTAALHAGKTVVLSLAAGIAGTLPAATGTGNVYRFLVGITFTGASSIVCASGTDDMIGTCVLFVDGGATVQGYAAVAGDDTIDLLGTANSVGGIAGEEIVLTDIASGDWHVKIVTDAGGTEATPFSATL